MLIKKAFSTIELLFVIVILAALAAISITYMRNSEESVTKRTMEADMKNAINEKYIEQFLEK